MSLNLNIGMQYIQEYIRTWMCNTQTHTHSFKISLSKLAIDSSHWHEPVPLPVASCNVDASKSLGNQLLDGDSNQSLSWSLSGPTREPESRSRNRGHGAAAWRRMYIVGFSRHFFVTPCRIFLYISFRVAGIYKLLESKTTFARARGASLALSLACSQKHIFGVWNWFTMYA